MLSWIILLYPSALKLTVELCIIVSLPFFVTSSHCVYGIILLIMVMMATNANITNSIIMTQCHIELNVFSNIFSCILIYVAINILKILELWLWDRTRYTCLYQIQHRYAKHGHHSEKGKSHPCLTNLCVSLNHQPSSNEAGCEVTIFVVVHLVHFWLPKWANGITNYKALLNSESKTISCWNEIIFDICIENSI